jgi:hypothetical protein
MACQKPWTKHINSWKSQGPKSHKKAHLKSLYVIFFFWVLQKAFLILQYLGVMAGIGPTTQHCIPGAVSDQGHDD